MNDPFLFPPISSSGWVDVPGNLHDGSGSFSFADGHVELHPWIGSLRSEKTRVGVLGITRADRADVHWMSYHSARASTNSF